MLNHLKEIITFKTNNVKPKQALDFIVRGSFICDILGSIYLILIYLPRRLPGILKSVLSFQGVNLSAMEPDLVNQMGSLATGNMKTLVIIFFILHVFIYYFTLKEKKWAIKYIKGFSLSGFIFGLLMITETFEDGIVWLLVNLLITVIYFTVFRWSRHWLKNQEQ